MRAGVVDIMERHPGSLSLVGYPVLGPEWDRYRDRIERIGFLGARIWLRCIAETDINPALLELGNPFCEGKSGLKFCEAALVRVPTVASATETFSAAVEDGISGFLARDAAEWRRAIELLIASESRRKAMGEAARAAALAHFSLAAVTPRAIAALRLRQRAPIRLFLSVRREPSRSGIAAWRRTQNNDPIGYSCDLCSAG